MPVIKSKPTSPGRRFVVQVKNPELKKGKPYKPLIEKKNKSEALKFLPKLNSELMKIPKTGIVKKQNASRNISRITKKINNL